MNYSNRFGFYLPTKLVYEVGAIKSKLAGELGQFKASSVVIVTDKGVVGAGLLKDVESALETAGIKYAIFDEVEPNPSTETCYKGAEVAKSIGAEAIVTVGGGSPMDVAKAVAILVTNGGDLDGYEGADKFSNDPLPLIAIPTTAGTGSEVTPFAVITIKARNYKMTVLSNRILPRVAILDPLVIGTVPAPVAAACGMDALTHAIEAFINQVASPATDAMAVEAMRLIGKYLRAYVANRQNLEAAGGMLVASNLAGIAFGIARLGNCHAMAHPLGGFFNIAHGVANAILLPHIMEFNMLADRGKFKRIAALLGEDVSGLTDLEAAPLAVEAVKKLSKDIGIPATLSEVGVKEEAIPQMSKDAMLSGNVKINPRSTTLQDIENLFKSAM
ncbi:MAG: iron-containing alcohol dehydrogenase [Syntrophomonadaceae bacterium]|nr:iron-containing alcohol dehydrogenase [Syntrophomonadaceae bacterium]